MVFLDAQEEDPLERNFSMAEIDPVFHQDLYYYDANDEDVKSYGKAFHLNLDPHLTTQKVKGR